MGGLYETIEKKVKIKPKKGLDKREEGVIYYLSVPVLKGRPCMKAGTAMESRQGRQIHC